MGGVTTATAHPAPGLRRRHIAGIVIAVAFWVLTIAMSDPTINVSQPGAGWVTAQDARSYFGLNLSDLYAGRSDWNTIGAYPYSPAFAQLVYPLNLLPWTVFVGVWTALLIGAVYLLTGPELFLVGLLVGAMEIAGGNISLLLTLAIVAGFRRPWTWAFVLLTKITPGVGLLWFVLRREWRNLGIALGATAGVVAVSFLVLPDAWRDWIDLLRANTGKGGTWAAVPIPLIDPRARRRRADHLGCAAEPALDGPGWHDALPARALVRVAGDAAGRDPADDARGAVSRLGEGDGDPAAAVGPTGLPLAGGPVLGVRASSPPQDITPVRDEAPRIRKSSVTRRWSSRTAVASAGERGPALKARGRGPRNVSTRRRSPRRERRRTGPGWRR